jgi:hypothetical protein
MKLPAHRAGLPGIVIINHIVPPNLTYKVGLRGTVRSTAAKIQMTKSKFQRNAKVT